PRSRARRPPGSAAPPLRDRRASPDRPARAAASRRRSRAEPGRPPSRRAPARPAPTKKAACAASWQVGGEACPSVWLIRSSLLSARIGSGLRQYGYAHCSSLYGFSLKRDDFLRIVITL